MSVPSFWQTAIYLITTDIPYRILRERIVSLPLMFSAGGNVITLSFIENKLEYVVALKMKCHVVC
jgi:hypothetical protein